MDGKYYSPLGTAVTTTISNSEIITAGRKNNASFWFMTTDKSASNISYTSALTTGGDALILWNYGTFDGSYGTGSQQWANAISGKTIVVVKDEDVHADLIP